MPDLRFHSLVTSRRYAPFLTLPRPGCGLERLRDRPSSHVPLSLRPSRPHPGQVDALESEAGALLGHETPGADRLGRFGGFASVGKEHVDGVLGAGCVPVPRRSAEEGGQDAGEVDLGLHQQFGGVHGSRP